MMPARFDGHIMDLVAASDGFPRADLRSREVDKSTIRQSKIG